MNGKTSHKNQVQIIMQFLLAFLDPHLKMEQLQIQKAINF
jgi:hypothetical protein